MAGYGWGTSHSVEEWLLAEASRFDFHQAVRLLEALQPDAAPVGEGDEPRKEAVRFRGSTGMAFPPSDVARIDHPSDAQPPEMTVTFMTLAGAQGPLPQAVSELVQRAAAQQNHGVRDFLDIFHHRLIALLHRIKREHHVGLDNGHPATHRFTRYLRAMLGLGTPGTADRMSIPDTAFFRFAGLLSGGRRSISTIEMLVGDVLRVDAKVHPFGGRWVMLDEESWTRIGVAAGRNNALGQGAMLGRRAWDDEAGITVELGPLGWDAWCDLLPGGGGFKALCELLRFSLAPGPPEIDLCLRIRSEERRTARLGASKGPRLGWTSWLAGAMPAGETRLLIRSIPIEPPANNEGRS